MSAANRAESAARADSSISSCVCKSLNRWSSAIRPRVRAGPETTLPAPAVLLVVGLTVPRTVDAGGCARVLTCGLGSPVPDVDELSAVREGCRGLVGRLIPMAGNLRG
ncbi:hypothetical protein AX14_004889 [Amanita brunnescens Koide BX004]|nr:hypothetical protein AX14_004889 [Amanita brunnescens Koide BX004]